MESVVEKIISFCDKDEYINTSTKFSEGNRSKSMFPKICTRSNIHKDVKPHLLNYILNCERRFQSESQSTATNQ